MSIVDGAGMFDAVAGVRSVFKLSARDIRSNARAVGGDRVEVRRSLWNALHAVRCMVGVLSA